MLIKKESPGETAHYYFESPVKKVNESFDIFVSRA